MGSELRSLRSEGAARALGGRWEGAARRPEALAIPLLAPRTTTRAARPVPRLRGLARSRAGSYPSWSSRKVKIWWTMPNAPSLAR